MKILKLRRQTNKQLIKLKKQLELSLIRSKSNWSSKEEKLVSKAGAKAGVNTKQAQQIRRTIAQINSIFQQRKLSEQLCKDKPLSKRRTRRLRGRAKG